MKKVDIVEVVLKEYDEKELVHFLATKIAMLNSASANYENADFTLGQVSSTLITLSQLATALDRKMNGSDDVKTVL